MTLWRTDAGEAYHTEDIQEEVEPEASAPASTNAVKGVNLNNTAST